jgi:hypothetical protein
MRLRRGVSRRRRRSGRVVTSTVGGEAAGLIVGPGEAGPVDAPCGDPGTWGKELSGCGAAETASGSGDEPGEVGHFPTPRPRGVGGP